MSHRSRCHFLLAACSAGRALGSDILSFYELMTAPSGKILNQWFESEPLKATLATDSLIGAMMGPNTPGSGYIIRIGVVYVFTYTTPDTKMLDSMLF